MVTTPAASVALGIREEVFGEDWVAAFVGVGVGADRGPGSMPTDRERVR